MGKSMSSKVLRSSSHKEPASLPRGRFAGVTATLSNNMVPFITCVLLGMTVVFLIAGAQEPLPQQAPDFEEIELKNGVLKLVDTDRRTIFVRTKSVLAAVHWLPGEHPEGRPWHAVEFTVGRGQFRLDCKEGDDARKIVESTFYGDAPD